MIENNNKEDFKVDEENKIYIIGGRGVGKTTFLHLLLSDKFYNNLNPSELGIIKSQLQRGNKYFTLKDLTDDENFSKTYILKNELEDVLLIFVLFSLDDKNSFKHAQNLIQFIKTNLINNKEIKIYLLGNKYDIGENDPNLIEVKKEDIDQYICNIENIYYYEISCKTNYNISKIKDIINEVEIVEEKDEDDDKLPEEERKKKVKEAKEKSCIIY